MSTDPLKLAEERICVKMGVVWCCFDDSDDYYLNLEPREGWRHYADCYLTNRGWCVVYSYPIIRMNSYSTTIEQFHESICTYLNKKSGANESRVYWPTKDEKKKIRTEFATIPAPQS